MDKYNKKKQDQLGMPVGTASARLKKNIMFNMAQKLELDKCFRCGKKIKTVDDLTIDHKKHWLDVDTKLFWDLKNIAFSHAFCNMSASRNPNKGKVNHGTLGRYQKGCRCDLCKKAKQIENKRNRKSRNKK